MRETNSSRNYETRQSEYLLRASYYRGDWRPRVCLHQEETIKNYKGGRVMKPKKQTEIEIDQDTAKLLELIGDGLAMSPDEVARLQKNLRGLRSLCQRAQAAKDCGILQSLGNPAKRPLQSSNVKQRNSRLHKTHK
jgi:hypothetical protein